MKSNVTLFALTLMLGAGCLSDERVPAVTAAPEAPRVLLASNDTATESADKSAKPAKPKRPKPKAR